MGTKSAAVVAADQDLVTGLTEVPHDFADDGAEMEGVDDERGQGNVGDEEVGVESVVGVVKVPVQ